MTPAGQEPDGAPSLLERQSDLSALEEAAARLRADHGGVVCVTGRAGIGKTSLLATWIERERGRDLRIVQATGGELDHGVALQLARRLLSPLVEDAGSSAPPAWDESLRALARQALSPAAEADPGPTDAVVGLVAGLNLLVASLLGDEPLVLVVDDAHLCDLPSLGWLAGLAERLDRLRILLVLALRTDGAYPTDALLRRIADLPGSHVIAPRPLTSLGIARLVRAQLGPDADYRFCVAVWQATEGNPLLVGELLRTLAERGTSPSADQIDQVAAFRGQILARTVMARLRGAERTSLQLVTALAVLEDDAPPPVVAALAGLDAVQLVEATRELRRLGALRDGVALRFAHPLIRSAVTASVPPEELVERHAAAAGVYHDGGHPPEKAAAHLLNTGPLDVPWAGPVLRRAARVARGRGVPDVAVAYLRRALAEPLGAADRVTVLLDLADCEIFTNPDGAAHHLTQGIELMADPVDRARAAALTARALALTGNPQEAMARLRRAGAELAGTGGSPADPVAQDLLLQLEAQTIQIGYENVGTLPGMRAQVELSGRRRLSGDTPGEQALLAALTVHAMAGHRTADDTAQLADRAFRAGALLAGPLSTLFPLAALSFLLCERFEQAEVWLRQMTEAAQRSISPRLYVIAAYGRAALALRRGDLADAVQSGRSLLQLGPQVLHYSVQPIVAVVVHGLIERDELAAAEDLVDRYRELDAPHATWDRGPFLYLHARLLLALGRPMEALPMVLECGRHQDAAGLTNPAITPWRSQAGLTHAALGHHDEAVRLAREEIALSEHWGTPRTLGISLRRLGVLTGGAAGVELTARAVAELERCPSPLELAKGLRDHGLTCLAEGDLETARHSLARALGLAEQRGAARVAAEIREALRRSGARPRRAKAHPLLTDSELQVAVRAGQGMTNRQIAQELFVTARTVEIHLTSTYRKLGIRGRPQLVEALDLDENRTASVGPAGIAAGSDADTTEGRRPAVPATRTARSRHSRPGRPGGQGSGGDQHL